jgi:kumamolisin
MASQKKPDVSFVPLTGSRHQALANSRPAGPIDTSEIASITVRTRPATNTANLEKRVNEIYAQPLTKRDYISREELARLHGGNTADLDAIEQYAQKYNLVVSHRNPAERTLVLTGTLGDLLTAFPADLHLVHHSGGTHRERRGDILVPKQFEGIITGIFGFDTRPKHRSPFRLRSIAAGGPGGDNGVSSTEFAKRYKFPTDLQGAKLDGSGQCIGIIELGGGFNNSDLRIYFQEIGVPEPKVAAVSVDHTGNHPTRQGADDGEVMLDIEVAGAVAPKATVAVYFAPNTNKGFLDAINFAIHDSQRTPGVISISWGGPEVAADPQSLQAFHEVFLEAAALGVTICTAAGDHGTADLDASSWDGKIHVDHPSVDPLVLACGGTQIDANNQDVVWNDGTPFDANAPGGGGWATGGGVSETFPVPDYQKNAKVPVSLATGKAGRGVPDIAMSATNYFVRVQGGEGTSGGTSAVAPLMASLVALLNQARKKNVGFLNPFLYANATSGIVTDVTKGTNAIANAPIKGYNAGPGWDACSGLGTPDGAAILAKLDAMAAGA